MGFLRHCVLLLVRLWRTPHLSVRVRDDVRGGGPEGVGGGEEGAYTSGGRVAATLVLGFMTPCPPMPVASVANSFWEPT